MADIDKLELHPAMTADERQTLAVAAEVWRMTLDEITAQALRSVVAGAGRDLRIRTRLLAGRAMQEQERQQRDRIHLHVVQERPWE